MALPKSMEFFLGISPLFQAYSLVDREVGYCQGSAFIVGLLLMQVGIPGNSWEFRGFPGNSGGVLWEFLGFGGNSGGSVGILEFWWELREVL